MTNLRNLYDRGRWCEVRLVLLSDEAITVQVRYALQGGATSARTAKIPWDELGRVAEVIDGLAADVLAASAESPSA